LFFGFLLILIPFFLASRLPFIPLIRFENKTVSTDAFLFVYRCDAFLFLATYL
jgi:hypothetical protein